MITIWSKLTSWGTGRFLCLREWWIKTISNHHQTIFSKPTIQHVHLFHIMMIYCATWEGSQGWSLFLALSFHSRRYVLYESMFYGPVAYPSNPKRLLQVTIRGQKSWHVLYHVFFLHLRCFYRLHLIWNVHLWALWKMVPVGIHVAFSLS